MIRKLACTLTLSAMVFGVIIAPLPVAADDERNRTVRDRHTTQRDQGNLARTERSEEISDEQRKQDELRNKSVLTDEERAQRQTQWTEKYAVTTKPNNEFGGKLDTGLIQLIAEFRDHQISKSGTGFQSANEKLPSNGEWIAIDAVATGEAETLLRQLENLGLRNGGHFGRMVAGELPIGQLERASKLGSLKFARPAYHVSNVGLVTSQGDPSMMSDLARPAFGVDGTGSRVGILSDSFNAAGGVPVDIANDDLPADTAILVDDPFGSDEGRVMGHLVHDVAPGAAIAFQTVGPGQATFASGILDLATAGSDAVTDDIIFLAEPMFQDGIIAQAVDTVEAAGVSYFSAAGNNARFSYEAPYVDSGAPGIVFGGIGNHDFDPGAGVDIFQEITLPAFTGVLLVFQWEDPFFSVSGAPGAASDVDICLYDEPPGAAPLGCSADINIGGDPVEILQVFTGAPTTYNIVIEYFSGAAPGLLKYVDFFGLLSGVEYDTASGTIYGHANAAGAEAVGAAFYLETPVFGTAPPLLEPFSSAGGTPILFDTSGTPIAPVVRSKPGVVGPDGTNHAVFSFGGGDFEPDGFPNFFGTSGSAPHVAAVAALMYGVQGAISPTDVYTAMRTTAVDMDVPGFDFDTGFGLVNALAALGALPGDCGNGAVEPPEECDDGGGNSNVTPDACRTNCLDASCGDGVTDTGEDCDDGNNIGGDGCSPTCTVEVAYIESTVGCGTYSTIAGAPGAALLATVSACDDCTELVPLPFVFDWYGDTPLTDVRVASNGQINMDSSDFSNSFFLNPVVTGNGLNRIALAQEDLNPGASPGAVWALDTGSSFIIDFAGIYFFFADGDINAQVELYPDGTIDIRWGTMFSVDDDIAVGVQDDTRPSATAASGGPFGPGGIAPSAGLPSLTGDCRRFALTAGPPPPACASGSDCKVFVTSTNSDGNLGGVAGADMQCQVLASVAGVPGVFQSWLADSAGGPATNFSPSPDPYVLLDGTTIAADFGDLTDGTLLAPINVTETGVVLSGPAGSRVWTGANADGTPRDGGALCADWTMNSSFARGAQGRVDKTDSRWSFSGASPCDKGRRLYCVEQPLPADPPPMPKLVFATSTQSDGNLGGVAGADATCNALATAASLPGTYKAWLSDNAVSPNSTFSMSASGYFRVDGTMVAASYADLTDGTLLAPISVTETGALLGGPSGSLCWTGTSAFGSGLDGAKCDNWTSSGAIHRGAQGRIDSSSSTWSFSGASTCNKQRRLYCVEQ